MKKFNAAPPADSMQALGLPETHVRIPPGEPAVMTGVRPGRYDVHVSCGNYPLVAGPASIEIGATPIEGVRWEFGAAARLVVRVRDGAGKPVRDVTLYVASKETPTDPFTGALTDGAGQGEMHGLVAGAYVVSAPLVAGQPSTEIRIGRDDREAEAELVLFRPHPLVERRAQRLAPTQQRATRTSGWCRRPTTRQCRC